MHFGEKKMKIAGKTSRNSGSTVDAFFDRSLDRARKLDRGEKLPKEITLRFENASDMLNVLSAQRIKVLKTVGTSNWPVSDLAVALKRDRSAVNRDLKILEEVGIVQTEKQVNPGHGVIKLVRRRSEKCVLMSAV